MSKKKIDELQARLDEACKKTQWYVIIIAVFVTLGVIGMYYAVQEDEEKTAEYKVFISEMGCDALEFQAIHHEWESKRQLALKEHGGRC